VHGFAGEREALEGGRPSPGRAAQPGPAHARYDRDADENGVIINLANVVSVRVSKTEGAATGQYL